jgi:hypothetical protein
MTRTSRIRVAFKRVKKGAWQLLRLVFCGGALCNRRGDAKLLVEFFRALFWGPSGAPQG